MNFVILAIVGLMTLGGAAFGGYQVYKESGQADANSETEAKIAELEQKLADFAVKENAASTTKVATVASESTSELNALKAQLDSLKKQKSQPAITPAVETNAPTTQSFSKADLIAKVRPSVVYIESADNGGSAFAIFSDLLITNYHVVEGAYAVKTKSSKNEEGYAYLVAFDKTNDLALLEVEGSSFVPLTFSSSNKDVLPSGTELFVFGYPFGKASEASFKEGSLSRRVVDDGMEYLEVSAEIHPGNSGGPVVNTAGQVVGVSVATFGTTISGVSTGDSIKLAIPSDNASALYKKFLSNKKTLSTEQKTMARQVLDFTIRLNKAESDFYNGIDLFSKAQELKTDAPANEADSLFVGVLTQVNYLREKNNKAYPSNAPFGNSIDAALEKLWFMANLMHSIIIPSQLKINEARSKQWFENAYHEQVYQNARIDEFNAAQKTYRSLRDSMDSAIKSYFQ